MLILTRRPLEKIVINGNIVITLVDVGNGRAKIGVEAPPEVGIWRQELYDAFTPEEKNDALARPQVAG